MAEQPQVKATLGLTGATMNAMALIAPGCFLWTTFQLQAAATAPDGSSVASDMWAGIAFALALCFLTAFSYSEMARIYPQAGFGSCYYFAEKAFLDRESKGHHRWARLAKIITGWAAHLFYWVYPGVMLAFGATLLSYIYQQFTGDALSVTTDTILDTVNTSGVLPGSVTDAIDAVPMTGSAASSRQSRVSAAGASAHQGRPASTAHAAASSSGTARAAVWKSRTLIPCSDGLAR